MIRSATLMLGAGLLAAGMSAPLAARADAEDNALAFVIGAAAAHALHDDDRRHIRHPHRRDVVPVHRGWDRDRHWRTEHRKHKHWKNEHRKHKYWKHHRWQQKQWQAKHWKQKKWHAKHRNRYDHHDRRWDRHDRRWDRHDRRWDRHDRRHDRRDRHHDRKDRHRDDRHGRGRHDD
jgi:hypothetical protein